MPYEEKDGGWKETLLGLVVIVVVLWGGIYVFRAIYSKIFPSVPAAPGVVSMSAYFVDDTGAYVPSDSPNYGKSHLKIKGDVSQGGQLVKSGSVRLTVSTAGTAPFQQSIYIGFDAGHFETDDPAFRSIRPGQPTEIKAEVTATGLNAMATIHLNSEAPLQPLINTTALGYSVLAAAVLLVAVFFVAFTGRKTPFKNRVAIIFSYLTIAIFLAVPFVAPAILIPFPRAVSAMIGVPVGLVNTHTPDQPKDGTQWAVNIGGFSHFIEEPKASSGTAAEDQNATREKAGTKQVETQAGANPGTSGVANNKPSTAPPATSGPQVPAKTEPPVSPSTPTRIPVVQVDGGLVIPLYVIILSVIGGAINMTRKVPGFQREGEESDFSLARPITMVGAAVINRIRSTETPAPAPSDTAVKDAPAAPADAAAAPAPKTPEPSLEVQAQAIDDQLVPLVTQQLQRNCETEETLTQIQSLVSKMQDLYKNKPSNVPLLRFNSFEDWAAGHPRLRELLRGGWRVELLNQYMYLISAPFLAIVIYYVLDLLGLSKQGVVVVLSFSVGLISERIVSWILGIATGYLRTDTTSPTPKAA